MKKALVIIDMQVGFMNEHTEHLEQRIRDYIDSHGEEFDTIIGTKYINNENTACYIFEKWTNCMANTVETYLVPKISNKVDKVFEKSIYSCYSKEFKEYIKAMNIDDVYMCGVNTGCCVLHSAFDAYNDVVSCYVIADLCGSTSGIESHERAIELLKECITKERVIKSGLE